MTRYQQPDTSDDRRRAVRAPLVAGSFVLALVCAALRLHPGSGAPNIAPAAYASPVAMQIAPDQIAVPLDLGCRCAELDAAAQANCASPDVEGARP